MEKGRIVKEETVGGNMLTYSLFENGDGFGVSVKSCLFGEEVYKEVNDVTINNEVADALFELLVRNLVLPSTLREVTEDFISEIYSINS